ncbi:bifunctional UDP-N-acetylglucosamine pyrophosphorylase/glucosamine-1-phosphate N-acetyltransferase [Rhodothalassium salexigens DSM 2132]|uniref:Bifunctional protein GlmU n=1 Tax=Rhodothalassium salexigens DSM 2132 TaxID=1188247 RepID=A0A4R2PCU0_RHOSA|nr:bifunctional UDP-N-acetylglucosamine diphosphorylase/glucosamine-1-phosphate N-acetyltransferase GlmU [Rhodothalassium salexigens]MBB4212077.1 bifunctional UDP-N-acetylglucosamine pyrophosphorylase/glucosamine-1-phosphate N-acetyltransferase [Rhodothalassium salexigens DSM 2132]MBK1638294.1 UDP-N-acetylglucosamine diphosphorylase/glucosamine-1-phosphate N-acetyltransferase [Rhodothalassium salexigens DSM 2132]TCP32952.1 bifunctional UDP-N-acetylglucosamine pyrophosphorylase/glucosamine-1-phos
MTSSSVAAVILAAGKGTRMKSDRHKVLHAVGGRAMVGHVVAAVAPLAPARRVLVVGDKREQLEGLLPDWQVAVQDPPQGTGHAVMAAAPMLDGFAGDVLVLFGDTPLIPTQTLEAMVAARRTGDHAVVVLGFRPDDPGGYGRLVLAPDGSLDRIVEMKDATADERAIGLCNSGAMVFDGARLGALLDALDRNNAAGEYYLTDTVAAARARGWTAGVAEAASDDVLGVNSRADLALVERVFQARARARAMAEGATLIAPETVYFAHDTELGRDVTVGPQVVFGPGVRIADGVTVEAFCHLEGVTVERGATVGPFARLRPGSHLGEGARVGNFVELKKAMLGPGAKANHLSYIGDAEVGAGANIGAGTITCNYDGIAKHATVIGADAFIGSNSALVAPVQVGAGAIVGAGSVITRDVGAGDLAVARGQQTNHEGRAARLRRRKQGDKKQRA